MDVRRVPWVAEVCKTASSTSFLSGYEVPAPPLQISKQEFPYISYRQGIHAQGCLLTWFVCRFLVCVCCWYLSAFLSGRSNMMNLSYAGSFSCTQEGNIFLEQVLLGQEFAVFCFIMRARSCLSKLLQGTIRARTYSPYVIQTIFRQHALDTTLLILCVMTMAKQPFTILC